MFTAPIVHLFVLLFCQWCECAKTTQKPFDVQSSNFTKRPLNLYITANGKHAVVHNKTVDLNNCEGKDGCKVEKLSYAESAPPFLIKTRGSALIAYDLNADISTGWHTFGRPSIVQMLAASGHRTVAVGLEHLWKQYGTVEKLVDRLNLTNIVLIFPQLPYTDFDLLKGFKDFTKLDAAILISPTKVPPILTKTLVINDRKYEEFPSDSNAQEIVLDKPLKEGNQEKTMQPIANFLDFIHPR